jgi:hypothetical protein
MIPYCVKFGDIKPRHLAVYQELRGYVAATLYDGDCHGLCAEIALSYPELRHVRGKFAGGWEHSWLVFKDDPLTVIDPYPWASGSGPMLITLKHMSPWLGLYREVPDPPLKHPQGGE